jgi:hypothetical protein
MYFPILILTARKESSKNCLSNVSSLQILFDQSITQSTNWIMPKQKIIDSTKRYLQWNATIHTWRDLLKSDSIIREIPLD